MPYLHFANKCSKKTPLGRNALLPVRVNDGGDFFKGGRRAGK